MKAQVKILGPVHESLLQVTYASSEGTGERAHSCNIGYLKQQGDKSHWPASQEWQWLHVLFITVSGFLIDISLVY